MGKIQARVFFILVLVFSFGNVYSQDVKLVDSIKTILHGKESISDSVRLGYYLLISLRTYNAEEKLKYGELAINLSFKLNDDFSLAKGYERVASAYRLKGELYKALDAQIKALNLFEKLKHNKGISTSYNIIGTIYLEHKNYPRAVHYFKQAIDLNSRINERDNLAGDYNNLGETYRLWGKTDSAIYFFNKALEIYDQLNLRHGIAYAQGNIGLVYAELGYNDSAEYYIHKATNILEDLGDRYPIAVYQTYMADIYKDMGDVDKALDYALTSLQIANEEGLKEQVRDASLKLSELYRDMSDFENAYRYQNQYIVYRDSINNEDIIRKMADLRTEYEVSKKQAEVDLLQQKRQNQRLISIALASGLLLISILAFFTFRNNHARKKTNKILSDQNDEIESQRDRLNDLNKMKDKFFGIISHDLRSPVNSLQSITQLLKHYVKTKNTDELEQLTVLIEKSVGNLSSLLDNLLNWALTQQGSLPYDPKKVDLNQVVNGVLDIFKNASQAKNIELATHIPEGLAIWADEDSIDSLLRNVVNNAIKFTQEKGRVEIEASNKGDLVHVSVSDTGVGMDEAQLHNLFRMNRKKVIKGTSGEKGSGLGMLLCKEIINLNQGNISAKSTKGEGTVIEMELPKG